MFRLRLRRSLLRTTLACVVAVVLPAKALAAAVIPITGAPNHAHDAQAAAVATPAGHAMHGDHEHHAGTEPAGPHCSAHIDVVQEDGSTPHEHACPHLGMASVPAMTAEIPLLPGAPSAPDLVDTPQTSVVLDVPSPPPTAVL
jgi:hypothetical protein